MTDAASKPCSKQTMCGEKVGMGSLGEVSYDHVIEKTALGEGK
jgi:hypothetical protein